MKRPPGLWLFCIAGIGILLQIHSAESVRATSLIFAKTTTTTSTAAPTAADAEATAEGVTEAPGLEINNTATKPPLTGIPQIDYIYDPNLPRELNGYNLTDYPFYDRLPEEIDFKCDGLHDGFYASVTHKCQVYHHCLFGTRFDFLCANFTAFDQKTFICHFASEVDCVNSPKYWHRNDNLYEATTTTTQKTTTVYSPPEPPPRRALSGPGGTVGRRRRPLRRRRPQYEEYYDDVEEYDPEYDDEPRSGGRRRKRPQRPRRPQYEEDEYDYEDERYDRDRRPYDRRSEDRRRNKDRDSDRSHEDDRRDDDRKSGAEGKRPAAAGEGRRNKPKEERRYENRRPTGSGGSGNRRPAPVDDEEYDTKPRNKPPRKYKDEEYDDEDRRPERPSPSNRKNSNSNKEDSSASDTRSSEDSRDKYDRPRKGSAKDDSPSEERSFERDRDRPRKNQKEDMDYKRDTSDERSGSRGSDKYDRPRKGSSSSKDDADDRGYERDTDRDRNRDRPRKNQKDDSDYRTADEPAERGTDRKVFVKPNTGSSVYDRPRVPPKIRRPVPVSEQHKYAYKASTTPKPLDDDYYYDDEEEEPRPPPPPKIKPSRASEGSRSDYETRRPSKPNHEEKRSSGSRLRPVSRDPEPEDDRVEDTRPPAKSIPKMKPRSTTTTAPPPPAADEEYYDEYEETEAKSEEIPVNRQEVDRGQTRASTKAPQESNTTPKDEGSKSDTSREQPQKERNDPVVRVHKRPFLPSRGGNPYAARGLQPVGTKAVVNPAAEPEEQVQNQPEQEEEDTSSKQPQPLPLFKKNKPRDSIPIYEEETREKLLNEPPSGPKVTLRTYSEEKPRIYSSIPDDKSFKPSPPLLKLTERPASFNPQDKAPRPQQQQNPNPSKPTLPQTMFSNNQKVTVKDPPRTTQKPKIQETRNPLDINENEYDVTLNDALNPTLPNLPIRGYPTGFSAANDYTWAQYQPNRNRYNPTAAESYKVQVTAPIRPSVPQNKYGNGPAVDLFPSGSGQIKSYQIQNFRQTQRQTPQYYSIF